MTKSISQIRDEISNFYLSIQNEITDVSTGSVAGGLIYALSVALKEVYDDLDDLERQAYIATATGRYLDLLIEGGFFIPRVESSRSTGYVIVYGDSIISDPEAVGRRLICASYDYETGDFVSGLSGSTKFAGSNRFGSGNVVYSLIQPKNSAYYKYDSDGQIYLDLKNKQAKYFILPVASVLKGTQVNLNEGALSEFINPPNPLRYVSNVSNPSNIILNSSGVSSAPLYSRNTSVTSFLQSTNTISVVNAFNFSSKGFIDISYKADFPTRLIRAIYNDGSGNEISGGLFFEYSSKNQTSIKLKSSNPYLFNYENNVFSTYNISSFSYRSSNNTVTYYYDSDNDEWTASENVTLASGDAIGPSTPITATEFANASSIFFRMFFGSDPWVVQQKQDQVSSDIIYDPDSALNEIYEIKDNFKLSRARDRMTDEQYRGYFRNYLNGLPRATKSALEFAALQVPNITFAKSVPEIDSPTGAAVLLASGEDGQLSQSLKSELINYLKDDWVASGVTLIVRPPDLVNLQVSVSVSITNDSLKNSVISGISSSISSYIQSLNPGDEVRYSSIYSLISRISGVKNVSNLIIGKYNPEHYKDFPYNYAKTALTKLADYRPNEYQLIEDSVFREDYNEVTIASDTDILGFETVRYEDYETVLSKENLFSEYNDKTYGAIEGFFASYLDSESTPYSINSIFSDFDSISSDNSLRISFKTPPGTDGPLYIEANGVIYEKEFSENVVTDISLPVGSTDLNITFYSSDSPVSINNVQMFLHDPILDSYFVEEYDTLKQLPFIDSSKIKIVYDVTSPSSRYKKLSLLKITDESFSERAYNLVKSMIESDSLSLFKSVIRDYQYGTNFSGKNPQGSYNDSFVNLDEDPDSFKYFLVYLTTAPFTTNYESEYPTSPDTIKSNILEDYVTSTVELVRFYQGIFNPSITTVSPYLGINVE